MPMQWNDQADARLFANVLKLHVVKLDYPSLARAMGNGVTPKAISHRISKIKEKAKQYGRDHAWAFDCEEDIEMSARRAGKKGGKGGKGAKYFEEGDDEDVKVGVKEEWVFRDGEGWERDGGAVEEEEVPILVVRRRGARVGKVEEVAGSAGMGVEMGMGIGMMDAGVDGIFGRVGGQEMETEFAEATVPMEGATVLTQGGTDLAVLMEGFENGEQASGLFGV